MRKIVLLSVVSAAVLMASGAMGAASSSPAVHNPNCDPITNPVLKKACLLQPPPKQCDPSNPKPGVGNGCPISK